MIVFKDAEKHEPKEDDEYLCIVKCGGELYYANIFWRNSRWVIRKGFDIKVIAFSETPPETALKGISEDPEETVYIEESKICDKHDLESEFKLFRYVATCKKCGQKFEN